MRTTVTRRLLQSLPPKLAATYSEIATTSRGTGEHDTPYEPAREPAGQRVAAMHDHGPEPPRGRDRQQARPNRVRMHDIGAMSSHDGAQVSRGPGHRGKTAQRVPWAQPEAQLGCGNRQHRHAGLASAICERAERASERDIVIGREAAHELEASTALHR